MAQQKEQIVVVGFGWVGQANALALHQMGYPVAYFDPAEPAHHYTSTYSYDGLERLSEVLALDSERTCYIVCVGDRVSQEGVQDISLIQNALTALEGTQGKIMLRSTILPDVVETLNYDFYIPEFLHEKSAVEECANPYFFVVGRKTDASYPSFFSIWRRRTGLTFEGTPKEASSIKYLSNLWNAVRIAFVNEFGNTIGTPSSKENLDSIEHVINFVLRGDPYLRYGRAFGGHCLPKDMRAFTHWYEKEGKSVELLKGAYKANAMHEAQQEKYPVLPEWFSKWGLPHISGLVALGELIYSARKNIRAPHTLFVRYILRRPM